MDSDLRAFLPRQAGVVDPTEALAALGGVATRAVLVRATSRRVVDRALRDGSIVAVARDRYVLPSVDHSIARAHGLSGAHCLRQLPEDEALAIADSACRAGYGHLVKRVAVTARGTGSTRIRRIAAAARADAANPFESVLRSIALSVPGLNVEPQVLITSVTPWAQPDLVDRDLRIVLEADSFQWHGHRTALAADARRYNLLVADGWTVLRFSWEEVMGRPEDIRRVLVAVLARRRTELPPRLRSAA